MVFNKRIPGIIKLLFYISVFLALIQGVLVYTNISFTSDKATNALLHQIKTITQRDVVIDGDVRISVSLLPELIVDRIHIKNSEGFAREDFITVAEVSVQLALLPLLTGKLQIEELAAEHAQIYLIQKEDGDYNWSFDHLIQTDKTSGKEKSEPVKQVKKISRLTLGIFRLTDIYIKYDDESYGEVIEKHIERIVVDFEDSEYPQAEITGSLQGYPYDIELVSEPLLTLTSGQPWGVVGTGMIAGRKTSIDATLQLNEQAFEGSIDLKAQDINLGLLLEQFGIITGEDAACEEMKISAKLKGDNVTELFEKAEIEIQLASGYWKWRAVLKDEIRKLTFNKALLRASWNKPIVLHLDGKLFNEVIRIDFNTNRLAEFLDDIEKLDVDLKARIAESDIALKGNLDLPVRKNQFWLDISLKGKNLEKLNRILNSELPPFNNYRLTGSILANEKGYIVKADDASIGNTNFKTVIVIDTSSFKPFWTVNINSSQLQIKDFEFAESRIKMPDAETIKASLKQKGGEPRDEPGRNLKKIVDDPKMHFDLNLKVENVLAGESALGSSSFKLKLRDNALILEDVEINVQGGKIKSAVAFNIENNKVRGALKLDVHKFEYGVVARYFSHGSKQGGVISAKIDLKLGGKDFSRLFDHATGKLDVAMWPRNNQTKIFDMWANNLFLILLPEISKKESKVNCLVALMDLEDGIMKEDFFGMDTTKVWMLGNINVDFSEEHVTLSLYPRSKTAKMFAVQAPLRVEGSFDNIKLITNPVDITVAYFSFITSPLHVPARRVFDDKVPEDASEICEKFYDRAYVKQLKEQVEAEEQKEIDELLDSD
jgi:uncharacterized protein involved in outer membrane biogenesis